MADFISREAAIETLRKLTFVLPYQTDLDDIIDDVFEFAIAAVEKLVPAADVRPVVHGEWIDVPNGSIKAWKRKCSACGMYHRGKTDFCPNCGADMREKKEGAG